MATLQQFFNLKDPNKILVAGQDLNGSMYYLHGYGKLEFYGSPVHMIMVHWDYTPDRTNYFPSDVELESGQNALPSADS